MRYSSTYAALAALVSVVAADNAPVQNTNIGQTFAATLPTGGDVTGSVLGSGAPDGQGSNIQISLYNLPQGSQLSYGISANKVTGNDCSTTGGLLNPFGGVTGAACTEDNAAKCAIGDLSGKHGNAILQGGAGTGYFTANFVDEYLSTSKSSDAFFGNKAILISDQNGTPLTCANFINQSELSANAANAKANSTGSASASGGMATMTSGSGSATQASQSAEPSQSGNGASTTKALAMVIAAPALAIAMCL